MTTKSPSPASRSTVSSDASDSRMRSSSAWTSWSSTFGSRRPTSTPRYSPSCAGGTTPTSIVKASGAPFSGRSLRSTCGSPTVWIPASASASSYQPGRPCRTASSSTASRPTCRSTTSGGTLPLRNPGTRISRPSWDAAVFSSRSRASVGTSTSTRTRESGSSVVLVFMAPAIGRVTVAALALWSALDGPPRRTLGRALRGYRGKRGGHDLGDAARGGQQAPQHARQAHAHAAEEAGQAASQGGAPAARGVGQADVPAQAMQVDSDAALLPPRPEARAPPADQGAHPHHLLAARPARVRHVVGERRAAGAPARAALRRETGERGAGQGRRGGEQ